MSRTHHIQLVHDAISAVDKVHGDTSVDRDVTRESLEEIRDHIEVLLEALESDT